MNALVQNSEGKPFRYEWNGSQTVNIFTKDDQDEWVNFDVFTSDQIMGDTFHAHCYHHLRDREGVDARYLGTHTREQLLYGV